MVRAEVSTRALPIAGVIVLVSAVAVPVAQGWWVLAPTGLLLAVAAWLLATGVHDSTLWTAVICWGAVGLATTAPHGLVWPVPQLLGLAAASSVLRHQGWGRPDWLGPGRADRQAHLLALASIPLTTIALVAFIASGRTDVEAATEGLQSLPLWTLPMVGVGFVLVNPTVEEVLFRGALQTMVSEVSGRPSVGVAAQGLAFGAIHFNGVPGGPLGMAMAAVWGVVLGVELAGARQRALTGGRRPVPAARRRRRDPGEG